MDYLKTLKEFYKNDLKNTITCLCYILLFSILFFFPVKSHAASTDYIYTYKYYTNSSIEYLSWTEQKISEDGWIGENYVSTEYYVTNSNLLITNIYDAGYEYAMKSSQWNLSLSNVYTYQDCFDAGYKVLQIPTGALYEGGYICADTVNGVDKITLFPDEVESADDTSDVTLTVTQWDDYFCSKDDIANEIAYTYFEDSLIIDYSVRRSYLSRSSITTGTDGEALEAVINFYDKQDWIDSIKADYPQIPDERIHVMEYAGSYNGVEVFALCKVTPIQKSTTDITPDELDCRKAYYQYTGTSGEGLAELPDDIDGRCYTSTDTDYTFREWCGMTWSLDAYYTDGFTEICDPEGTTIRTIENSDGTTTNENLDVRYETDDTRDTISKEVIENTEIINNEGDTIYNSGDTITNINNIDKTKILGNGDGSGGSSNNEGTGSGEGEGQGSSDISLKPIGDLGNEDWYTSKYPDGFSGVLNKHIETYNNSSLGAFIEGLNPFNNSGSFPVLNFDLDFGDVVDFGKYSIDLQKIPMGETRTINLIALIKALLLIYACIYAFRQVF